MTDGMEKSKNRPRMEKDKGLPGALHVRAMGGMMPKSAASKVGPERKRHFRANA